MRHHILLFAVYLMALALVPCQDEYALVAPDAPAAVHAANSEHEHHDDSEHQDHCTPFCICACCGAFLDSPTELLPQIVAALPLPPAGTTQPAYSPTWKPLQYASGNWQPPRA
ncbi:hypothetical protein [Neolewinella agarilytica]|uniref:Uncharacterized protein n=1 Tax=Neolewinella agarilytica TaxID=478744 RepID=A0A1H9H497_9BACT|nr:hypothetical protein [Neolewinella agarilytica]SEQ57099.1 hypothetical protein SAMN05444359_1129 [Neolewinella agarilytica]